MNPGKPSNSDHSTDEALPECNVVLLHGWGLNNAVWQSLIPQFPKTWRLHVLDLPGYAGSPAASGQGIKNWVDDLINRAPDRATWVGWSLGATLAIQAGLDFPDRVDKLCLISPTPRFMKTVGWNCGMDQASLDELWSYFKIDYRSGLKRFLMLQTADRKLIRLLDLAIAQHSPPSESVLIESLDILTAADLRDQLHHLRQPLQVILGSQDRIVAPIASKLLAAHCEDLVDRQTNSEADLTGDPSLLVELDGGHLSFLEQPERFLECLIAFVERPQQPTSFEVKNRATERG